MGDYSIKVSIDQTVVKKFNKDNTRLCIAFGVGDTRGDDTSYNVVGATSIPKKLAQNVEFKWTDVFSIAGGTQAFKGGVTVDAKTDPKVIKFGQKIVLQKDFLLDPPVDDQSVGTASFHFENKPTASAYLYKKVQGQDKDDKEDLPFYVSANGPLMPGESKLTPKPKCRLFFANKVETSNMIDDYESTPQEVDLTGKTSAKLTYDSEGNWKEL